MFAASCARTKDSASVAATAVATNLLMAAPKKRVVRLSAAERKRLRALAQNRKSPAWRRRDAEILLRATQGFSHREIAKQLQIGNELVYNKVKRYAEGGLDAVLTRKRHRPQTMPVIKITKTGELGQDGVRGLLWEAIVSETGGDQGLWARRHRLSMNSVYRAVVGRRTPTRQILSVLGLEKIVRYRVRKGARGPDGSRP